MSNQLISVGFGKESFKSTSASLSAFVVQAPFIRNLPSKVYQRQGSLQKFPVSHYPDVNGWLFLDNVKDVPDGTVLLLQAQHRYNGSPIRDAGVFIALRSDGPLLQVQALLPTAMEATRTGTHLAFQGRGDVVTGLRDLRAYGVAPGRNYADAFMDEEQIAECYTINITAPQIREKPKFEAVQARDGEIVQVKARPGRKLSFRRPG